MAQNATIETAWLMLSNALKMQMSPNAYASYFSDIKPANLAGGVFTFSAPARLCAELERRYAGSFARQLAHYLNAPVERVTFTSDDQMPNNSDFAAAPAAPADDLNDQFWAGQAANTEQELAEAKSRIAELEQELASARLHMAANTRPDDAARTDGPGVVIDPKAIPADLTPAEALTYLTILRLGGAGVIIRAGDLANERKGGQESANLGWRRLTQTLVKRGALTVTGAGHSRQLDLSAVIAAPKLAAQSQFEPKLAAQSQFGSAGILDLRAKTWHLGQFQDSKLARKSQFAPEIGRTVTISGLYDDNEVAPDKDTRIPTSYSPGASVFKDDPISMKKLEILCSDPRIGFNPAQAWPGMFVGIDETSLRAMMQEAVDRATSSPAGLICHMLKGGQRGGGKR